METNKIMTFNYETSKVRTIEKNGEPWFVLKDVCKILEIKNTTDVAKRLDDDERTRFNLGRQGEATLINESGLYSVILRSDKPQSKPFRKWVTGEVLPSIRKTGSYGKLQAETKTNTLKEENQKIKKAQLMHEISKDITEPICKKVIQRHITELLTGERLPEVKNDDDNSQIIDFRVEGVKGIKIIVSDQIIKEPFYYWEINTDTHFLYMMSKCWNDINIRNKYINTIVKKLKQLA